MSRKFEIGEDGVVFERFEDGSVGYDIFDADQWQGTLEEGENLAQLIVDSLNLDYTKVLQDKLELGIRIADLQRKIASATWCMTDSLDKHDERAIFILLQQHEKEKLTNQK